MRTYKTSKKNRIKKSKLDIAFEVALYIIFGFIIFICAYPFYYLLICTISDNRMVALNQITVIPKGIHFQNYIDVLKLSRIRNAAALSIIKTVLGTATNMIISSYMAYFFSKEEVWHRKLFYRFSYSHFSHLASPFLYILSHFFPLVKNFNQVKLFFKKILHFRKNVVYLL